MIYPIIFIFSSLLVGAYGMATYPHILDDNYQEKRKKCLIIILVAGILLLIAGVWLGVSEYNVYLDSEFVAKCADTNLYYDVNADTYFIVQENLFNPFELFERIPIGNELALEKIEAYEFLNEPLN